MCDANTQKISLNSPLATSSSNTKKVIEEKIAGFIVLLDLADTTEEVELIKSKVEAFKLLLELETI